MRREVTITNIVWDTDGEPVKLPTKIDAWIELDDPCDFDHEEVVAEAVSDILSDHTGWCVEDFEWSFRN